VSTLRPAKPDALAATIMARVPSGIATPELRRHARSLASELTPASGSTVVAVALQLLRKRRRALGYELVGAHRGALEALDSRNVEALGAGIDSWGAVDHFACAIAGVAWQRRQVPDRLIARWARSKDRWQRRAALASTVPLNVRSRGGKGDAARTLAICRRLIDDRDDMIVKALSWALRELAVREPAKVSAFVAEHEDRLAKRVIREVKRKIETGRKAG